MAWSHMMKRPSLVCILATTCQKRAFFHCPNVTLMSVSSAEQLASSCTHVSYKQKTASQVHDDLAVAQVTE